MTVRGVVLGSSIFGSSGLSGGNLFPVTLGGSKFKHGGLCVVRRVIGEDILGRRKGKQ